MDLDWLQPVSSGYYDVRSWKSGAFVSFKLCNSIGNGSCCEFVIIEECREYGSDSSIILG